MTRLIRTIVERLESPNQGETVFMDSEVPGFGVRVTAGGVKSYFVRYRISGGRSAQPQRRTLGRHPVVTTECARRVARDILARARLGEDPNLENRTRRQSLSVASLAKEWLDGPGRRTRKGRPKTDVSFKNDRSRIENHVVPVIGQVKLCDLRRKHVEQLRDAVPKGKTITSARRLALRSVSKVRGGEGAATRTVATLSTLLGYAVEQELIEKNVALGVHKGTEKRCERYLSAFEIHNLMDALDKQSSKNPQSINILRLLLLTGCRYGEIAGAKWADLNLDAGIMMLKASKTGARPVYLSDAAKAIFNGLPRIEKSIWVFPSERGDSFYTGTKQVWPVVRVEAGLEGVRMHDLRHTFASTALAEGAPLEIIAKLLGHGELRTTARYAHLSAVAVREAANSVGRVVNGSPWNAH